MCKSLILTDILCYTVFSASPYAASSPFTTSLLYSVGVIADTWDFSLQNNFDHQAVVGSMKSLLADLYVAEEVLSLTYYTLTTEADSIVQNGSPEFVVRCYTVMLDISSFVFSS